MQSNQKQLLKNKGENLPIVSEDKKVQVNSMRLYTYLVCLSRFTGTNQPRRFSQKDFNLNQIRTVLRMDYKTIKKYWRLLEETGLVKYNGKKDLNLDWDKNFMERKKYSLGYYELSKENSKYRIIPRETLDKIRTQFLVNENELKLYLFLANLQEQALHMGYSECPFTLREIRELMGLSKEAKNNKNLYLNLVWLMKLNLVKCRVDKKKNGNFNEEITYFVLEKVNYYTDGGALAHILDENNQVLPDNIKNAILNDTPLVSFDI